MIVNYESGEYPIHVHGHRLYVMTRGHEDSGPYREIAYTKNIAILILKDTVTVAKNSSMGRSINKSLSNLNDLLVLCFSALNCNCHRILNTISKLYFPYNF